MAITFDLYGRADAGKRGLGTGIHVLNELLIALPLIVMAVVGVVNRAKHDPFLFVSYDKETNDKVEAYAPILREVKALIPNVVVNRVATTRRLAHEWVDGYRSGRFQELPIVSYDDTVDNGAKGEIYAANMTTTAALNEDAEREALTGDQKDAAADAILAMQASRVTQYFSLGGLTRTASVQRRSLDILRWSWPHLNKKERSEDATKLRELELSRTDLARVALDTRQAFVRRRVELIGPGRVVDALERSIPLSAVSTSTNLAVEQRRLGTMVVHAANDVDSIYFVQERLAIRAVQFTNRVIESIIAGVNRPHGNFKV